MKANKTKRVSLDQFPLSGFLVCPLCGRNLTGSPSKGKSKWYHYYHCVSSCGYRSKAETLNDNFEQMIKQFSPAPAMKEIYAEVIEYHYNMKVKDSDIVKKRLLEQIEEVNKRMAKGRELLINIDIEPSDYRLIKQDRV